MLKLYFPLLRILRFTKEDITDQINKNSGDYRPRCFYISFSASAKALTFSERSGGVSA